MATLSAAARGAGVVLRWIVGIILFAAITAVDIWILLTYGFFFWLIGTPILLTVAWLLFAVVFGAITGACMGVFWLFRKAMGRS